MITVIRLLKLLPLRSQKSINHSTRYLLPVYDLCSPHTNYGSLCRNSQGVFLPQPATNCELTFQGEATTALLIPSVGHLLMAYGLPLSHTHTFPKMDGPCLLLWWSGEEGESFQETMECAKGVPSLSWSDSQAEIVPSGVPKLTCGICGIRLYNQN